MENRCSEQCVHTPNDTERTQKAIISHFPTPFSAFLAQIWLRSSACPLPARAARVRGPLSPLLAMARDAAQGSRRQAHQGELAVFLAGGVPCQQAAPFNQILAAVS